MDGFATRADYEAARTAWRNRRGYVNPRYAARREARLAARLARRGTEVMPERTARRRAR